MVLDIPSPYNAIVGQDWVHRMRGVAYRLHQVIKFVALKGEEMLYDDQIVAKQCYLDVVNMNVATTEVQFMEEDSKVL